ncbi:polysaccharide deacetylase family protein [Rhodoferax aquaticus]|nr:polysaccharide deacetylase family protein [Rhodoferax aquaticus]
MAAARRLLVRLAVGALCCTYPPLWAQTPIEVHDVIASATPTRNIALTLDACSGAFDDDLIEFLIRNRIPATLFATKKWLLKNPQGVAIIKAHLDLFDVEDHGENHIPAVIGAGRKVYGIAGEPDLLHLRQEVSEGAKAITEMIGVPPHWYRGATAEYDPQAIAEIERMGFGIAGFSINADSGATLRKPAVEERLRHVKGGDVIIAHMNKPASDTAEGLSTGLLQLLRNGLVFVRLDQVGLSATNLPKEQLVRPSSNQ